jgi:hypothetical protein
MTLSMPPNFMQLQPSQGLKKCLNEHLQEIQICSEDIISKTKNVITEYEKEWESNPEALPDSVKMIVCCSAYSWKSCVLKAVSSSSGCRDLLEDYMKQFQSFLPQSPKISIKQFCVKYPEDSKDCLENLKEIN